MNRRTHEQQVHAALDYYFELKKSEPIHGKHPLTETMLKLLAGDFAEEPLPTMISPPWPHHALRVLSTPGIGSYCVVADGLMGWNDFAGPIEKTPREAIERWNDGMRAKA